MQLVIPVLVFLTIVFMLMAVPALNTRPLRSRMLRYAPSADMPTYESEIDKPLSEKMLLPLVHWLGASIGSLMPTQMLADTEKRLQQAGYPLGLNLNTFMLCKAAMMLVLPMLYVVLVALSGNGRVSTFEIVATVGLLYVGSRAGDWWLDHQVGARRDAINRALPDALDFIVICSEAGLAFEGAMARVVERMKGPLSDELKRTLGEISLGKRRRDALRALADRTEAHDLISFIAAVVQADQTGISIGNVLTVQADDLRLRRRQRAEKEGREAPLKMLFPNIFFIFPATIIVLIGPAALKIFDQMLAGG